MELRQKALSLFQDTLKAISVEQVIRKNLSVRETFAEIGARSYDLSLFECLIVIALGKAAVPMARTVVDILGARITTGIVVSNELPGDASRFGNQFQLFEGGHPLPNGSSRKAADAAIGLLQEFNSERTLVLFLISGGGSALFESPIDPNISLDDMRKLNRVLVGCGAVIGDMNIVRRFLSRVKGGRLAAAAPKSQQVSLYISDVNGDDLSSVSSGPTLAGSATRSDFMNIVARFNLLEQFPSNVSRLITNDLLPELPAPVHGAQHFLLMDSRVALEQAAQLAGHDLAVEIAADLVEGDVEEMAREHLSRVRALAGKHPGKAVCLLSGGEVICPVRGNGLGGRNQEFVLRAAINAAGRDEVVILSAGTDGIDGVSPAAGAISDQLTVERGNAFGIDATDYLERSDSYSYFAKLGDAVVTGPTGNNVRDLRILLARG